MKMTAKTASRPTVCQVTSKNSRRLIGRDDLGNEWLTDGRFAVRAELFPKLAARFAKLGIDTYRADGSGPNMQPVVDGALERGWEGIPSGIDRTQVGVGQNCEVYVRKAGSALIDCRYMWLFDQLDSRSYRVYQSADDPAADPIVFVSRSTDEIVGLVMPIAALNSPDEIRWINDSDLADFLKAGAAAKPKRWRHLPRRINGESVDFDNISGKLQRVMMRQLLKHAVSTAMTCPECRSVLDFRQSIYWQANNGERCHVRCRSCVKKALESAPATVGDFFATAMDVIDGCGL